MAFLGALICLDREYHDDQAAVPPPLIGLTRTPVQLGEPHPEQEDLLIGELEARGPGWRDALHFDTSAAGRFAPPPFDRSIHVCLGEESFATVHFDERQFRFVVTADLPLFDIPDFVPKLIDAFWLPRDARMLEIKLSESGEADFLERHGLDKTAAGALHYDLDRGEFVVGQHFASSETAPSPGTAPEAADQSAEA